MPHRSTAPTTNTKISKILGNAEKFLQHGGNGFTSCQLTFWRTVSLILYTDFAETM